MGKDRVTVSKGTKPTHKIPSGMGGVFDVILTGKSETDEEGREHHQVTIINSQYPDWHGSTFFQPASVIKPL